MEVTGGYNSPSWRQFILTDLSIKSQLKQGRHDTTTGSVQFIKEQDTFAAGREFSRRQRVRPSITAFVWQPPQVKRVQLGAPKINETDSFLLCALCDQRAFANAMCTPKPKRNVGLAGNIEDFFTNRKRCHFV